MKSNTKDQCCNGCKKGQPGQNSSCQAKLMLEELKSKKSQVKTTTS